MGKSTFHLNTEFGRIEGGRDWILGGQQDDFWTSLSTNWIKIQIVSTGKKGRNEGNSSKKHMAGGGWNVDSNHGDSEISVSSEGDGASPVETVHKKGVFSLSVFMLVPSVSSDIPESSIRWRHLGPHSGNFIPGFLEGFHYSIIFPFNTVVQPRCNRITSKPPEYLSCLEN